MERNYSMDSTQCVTKDEFKNGETLENSSGPIQVLGSIYAVQDKYKNIKTAQAFLTEFENAKRDELDSLRKHFLSHLFYNFKKDKDFVSMVTVLKCNDYTIQEEILQHVHPLVFSHSVDIEDETKLLDVLDTLLLILQHQKDYPCFLQQIQPLILDTFSLLKLKTLLTRNTTHLSTDLDIKCHSYSKFAAELRKDKNVDEARPVFDIILKFVKSLDESRLKHLGLEKWPNTLTNESEAVGWKTKSTEVPLTDLYAMLHATISQITQKSNHVAARFLQMFVTDLLRNYVQKQRRNVLLQPLVSLLTRGIVWILETKLFSTDQAVYNAIDELGFPPKEDWCTLLDICKSNLDSKGNLVPTDEIKRMMFRYSSEIPPGSRIAVSLPIEEHYVKHIQWLLPGLHVIVQSSTPGAWCTLRGTMFAGRQVKLHFQMKEKMLQYNVRTLRDNELAILNQLQTAQTHENVVRLLMHQIQASPKFYVVDYIEKQLYLDLIQRRNDLYSRMPLEKLLHKYLLDILMAIEYLHRKHIIVRKIMSHSFSVTPEKVVLTDLTLAQQLIEVSDQHGSNRDMNEKIMPTRWTAPESLTKDVYNEQSDVWMVGMIMYELYTLGCQPYTEMRSFSTDAIINKVVFHSLKPYKWSCIPEDVHREILKCTKDKPQQRQSVQELLATVKKWEFKSQDKAEGLNRQASMENQYPMIDPLQDPHETGIPMILKNLKEKEDMRTTYLEQTGRNRSYTGSVEITEDDICCADSPYISTKRGLLIVMEPVSRAFIEQVLPQMSKDFGNQMLIVKGPSRQARNMTHITGTGLKHNLIYGFDEGRCLLNESVKYGLRKDDIMDRELLNTVYEITGLVCRIHAKNWLFRDLCVENIYIDNQTNRAFFTRISRMVRLGKMSRGVYHGEMFQERVYWYPREVLMNEDFSKASDVYMLAMVFYEIYSTVDIIRKDPRGNILHRVPYADTTKTAILEKIHNGEKLRRPEKCPDWLYRLMVMCWSRDVTKRPDIESLRTEIFEGLQQQLRQRPYMPGEQNANLNVKIGNIRPFLPPRHFPAGYDPDIMRENPCFESGSSAALSEPQPDETISMSTVFDEGEVFCENSSDEDEHDEDEHDEDEHDEDEHIYADVE